ncbi:hypothetical protein J6590_104829, partial [Homalodisca vitripennis]
MPGRSTRGFNSPQSLFVLYNTLVRPLLEYGSVVWSPYLLGHTEELHRVQARFVRMLGVRLGFTLKHQYHNWSRSFLFNLSISDVSSVIGLPAPTASSCGAYALVNARLQAPFSSWGFLQDAGYGAHSAAAGFLHRERRLPAPLQQLRGYALVNAGTQLQQLRGFCTGERTFIVERNNVTLKLSLHLTLVEGYMSTVPAAAGLLHLQTL